jgi:K+-sensing histidine kinase KdpD
VALMRRRRTARAEEGGTRRSSFAMGGVLEVLAKIVDLIVAIIAVIILLAILFVVLEANRRNDIVGAINDVAKFLVGPFDNLFTPSDRKLRVAINYGIALAVYVIVGRIIASLLRRPKV